MNRGEEREIVLVKVSGHAGIRGHWAADSAAKGDLEGEISEEFIPYFDLNPRLDKYIFELWQQEWNECPPK